MTSSSELYFVSYKKKSSLAFEPLYNFCVDQGPAFLNHQVPYPNHHDCHLNVWIIIPLGKSKMCLCDSRTFGRGIIN